MKPLFNRRTSLFLLSTLLGMLVVLALSGFVQPTTPAAALEQFFTADELQADWFADAFLAQVPLAQIEQLRGQITEQLGAFDRIEGEASPFTVFFAKGNAMAAITLNAAGQIAGLRLTPAAATASPSEAEPTITPKAALARLFTSDTLEDNWFNDAFLAQVAPSQIADPITQWTAQYGDFVAVEGEQSPFTVRLADATIPAEISLDNAGRISGLFFHPPTPIVDTVDAAVAQFAELPGDVSLLVLRDGEEVAALNVDRALAVGSAFKLAVLAALRDQIDAGTHSWDEIVELDPANKSLPSGILQDWPDGSPLTVHTLATLMISISDNTAADTLIHLVGRDAIEAYGGANQPFLTTQEATKLKATANANLLTAYAAGDEAAKREVLDELADQPLPALASLTVTPTLAAEWHFTPDQLCDLMAQVQDLDVMTVSPGPAIPNAGSETAANDWQRIAYKGGSETGVLNLTYWLERADGTAYCVAVTQNRPDAAIDQIHFSGLTSALIGTLSFAAATDTATATTSVTNSATVTTTTFPTATNTLTATAPATATFGMSWQPSTSRSR